LRVLTCMRIRTCQNHAMLQRTARWLTSWLFKEHRVLAAFLCKHLLPLVHSNKSVIVLFCADSKDEIPIFHSVVWSQIPMFWWVILLRTAASVRSSHLLPVLCNSLFQQLSELRCKKTFHFIVGSTMLQAEKALQNQTKCILQGFQWPLEESSVLYFLLFVESKLLFARANETPFWRILWDIEILWRKTSLLAHSTVPCSIGIVARRQPFVLIAAGTSTYRAGVDGIDTL